jgi:hypothetical protein
MLEHKFSKDLSLNSRYDFKNAHQFIQKLEDHRLISKLYKLDQLKDDSKDKEEEDDNSSGQ